MDSTPEFSRDRLIIQGITILENQGGGARWCTLCFLTFLLTYAHGYRANAMLRPLRGGGASTSIMGHHWGIVF